MTKRYFPMVATYWLCYPCEKEIDISIQKSRRKRELDGEKRKLRLKAEAAVQLIKERPDRDWET